MQQLLSCMDFLIRLMNFKAFVVPSKYEGRMHNAFQLKLRVKRTFLECNVPNN